MPEEAELLRAGNPPLIHSFIHSLTHSLNTLLLNDYYVLNTYLGTKDSSKES